MDKLTRLRTLYNEWSCCQKCPLLCHERKSVVFGYGQYEKVPIVNQTTGQVTGLGGQVLIVGEAPGMHEDEQGVPFVGKSGMLLNQYLAAVSVRPEVKAMLKDLIEAKSDTLEQRYNYQLRELLCQEFFFTNVIACHPPENRDPTPKEVAACRPRLLEILYLVDPVVIIAVGRIAVEALIGRKVSITQIRGEMFDVPVKGRIVDPFKYPLIATLHPSYLMRKNDFNQKGGDGAKTFRDFLRAMKIVDEFNFRHHGIAQPLRPKEDE
jgi:uracil-DNA glycosylase family 4